MFKVLKVYFTDETFELKKVLTTAPLEVIKESYVGGKWSMDNGDFKEVKDIEYYKK